MNFIKNNKAVILSILCLIIMIGGVLMWNKIVEKQNEPELKKEVDLTDVNNIESVESKLGEDIKITQGYLLTYLRKKSNTWYLSKGYVKKISNTNGTTTITLTSSKDSKQELIATIDTEKWEYKKGDTVNFVGTIDLNNKSLSLSKISKEKIDYKNVIEIDLDKLSTNIDQVKANYFIINGYMVTDNKNYKLYDSKDSYNTDPSVGTYFTISWKDKFELTGNSNVTIKCLIEDTYKLNSCELQQN